MKRKTESMMDHVPEHDMDKLKFILEVKDAYNSGSITLEEGQRRLRERVDSIKPYEVALAEQELEEFEEGQCQKEDIQSMLALFEGLIDRSRPELPADHPIARYYAENDELEKICLSIEDLVQYPLIKNQWLSIYDRLKEYKKHLSRKQNQLYSMLEKKGFDRPTTTMWTLDDFIWEEIGTARKLLDTDEERFIDMQPTLVADIRDLISKEQNVLYPTSLILLTPDEFRDMAAGDHEIGFAWIDAGEKPAKDDGAKGEGTTSDLSQDLLELLGKHGLSGVSASSKLHVAEGSLTLEQINLIYKHLPVDLSYVDENELVCFYSDTKHRVFPRSKNVIGRDIMNCHPRKSAHIVREIIDKFRSGEQESAEFWINKPNLFIYITYLAVRDENGTFRGILEMMQDCTHIRSLEGSQTLLTWSAKEHGGESADGDGEQARDSKAEGSAARPDKQAAAPAEGSSSTKESSPEGDTAPAPSAQATSPINGDTRLRDLLAAHPWLKDALPQVNEKFALLNSPLARVMIPKATVRMMAERSGMNLDELSRKISELISAHGE